jgi:hypothetical protein
MHARTLLCAVLLTCTVVAQDRGPLDLATAVVFSVTARVTTLTQ